MIVGCAVCLCARVWLLYALQGVWTRVRLAVANHVGASIAVTLTCVGGGTACCEARQLARDSMYLSSLPAAAATTWTLSSVGRLDLAVKCTAAGTLAWGTGSMPITVSAAPAGGVIAGGDPVVCPLRGAVPPAVRGLGPNLWGSGCR